MTQPRTIYAVPNFECNLSCPHCELSRQHIAFDHAKFMQQLKSSCPEDKIVLFGGEPTLFEDRFIEIMKTGKVTSISTNLLALTDSILGIFKQNKHVSIGTSWNLSRFTPQQEAQWLSSLQKLSEIGRKCAVLVTMTQDLIADSSYHKIHDILSKVQSTNGVDKILFEHYIGDSATADYNTRCDEWLCRMHSDWKYSMKNQIDEKVLGWKFDCTNVMTLLPNGILRAGCPQDTCRSKVCIDCLTCNYASICRPCALQHSCSFPKKLYSIIKKEKQKES